MVNSSSVQQIGLQLADQNRWVLKVISCYRSTQVLIEIRDQNLHSNFLAALEEKNSFIT